MILTMTKKAQHIKLKDEKENYFIDSKSLLILSCEEQNLDKGYKPHKQNGQTI
jgi:hypothetical protein